MSRIAFSQRRAAPGSGRPQRVAVRLAHHRHRDGLTLVELLAAIVLAVMLCSALTGVLQ